jgi:hypothetical protein
MSAREKTNLFADKKNMGAIFDVVHIIIGKTRTLIDCVIPNLCFDVKDQLTKPHTPGQIQFKF